MRANAIRDVDATGASRPVAPATRGATLSVTRRFSASPERVFDAWIDPSIAARWLFATAMRPMTHAVIDARPAGRFRLLERRGDAAVEFAGRYVTVTRPSRLVFWLTRTDAPDGVSLVDVTLHPQGCGARVALTHTGVRADRVSTLKARWTGILFGLGVTLATEDDRTLQSAGAMRRAARGGLQCTTC